MIKFIFLLLRNEEKISKNMLKDTVQIPKSNLA